QPGKLALSEDGQFLYLGLAQTSLVYRISPDSGAIDFRLWLGNDPNFGPYLPFDLAVLPGRPQSVAVSAIAPSTHLLIN
ncbi:MAG: hypothetical protein NTW95_04980, partial [Candidatus Aminicenantes bacterium]|nr:hypothetical protein [Candidatus Aminicenantes bacterium]